MRRWALTGAFVLIGALIFLAFAEAIWALSRQTWWGVAAGMSLIGGATAAAAALLQRPVRASFRPGGGVGAFVALAVSIPLTAVLLMGAWQAYLGYRGSQQVAGDAYGYSLIRPSRAWIDLPSPRPLEGHPLADLELTLKDGRARVLVVVEDEQGDAEECLARVGRRVKSTGLHPTVYQVQRVSAGGLMGAQGIVSVEPGAVRIANLITCYSRGGQHYQVLGVARESDFEALRPDLARLSTSFRLDPADDPLRLDIHTRRDAARGAPGAAPGSLAAVVSRSETAVVLITAHLPGKHRGYGSGALLRPDGLIVTNNHVIEDAEKIMVGISGHGMRRARRVATDPAADLVILKIPGRDLPYLTLATDPVRTGDDVIAIGSPMGLTHTVTKGIISSTRRSRNNVDYLQTDVSINPGSSGGPLLNLRGEVVGISTFIVRESEAVPLTGLNFAVPARYVREMAARSGLSLPLRSSRAAAPIAPEA
jgi:S1-C subfamily serine protease